MRSFRRSRTGCLFVAVAALTLLSSTQVADSSPVHTSMNQAGDAADVSSAASRLAGLLTANVAGFSYIQITDGHIDLGVTSDPAAVQGIVNNALTLASDASVVRSLTYTSVTNSLADLENVTASLTANASAWSQRGVHLSAFGPDITSNSVLVHLFPYSEAAAKELVDTFGSLITIADDSVPSMSAGRTNDTSPWFGGDRINRPGTSCSSWFGVYNTSTGAGKNVTAGHCGTGTWTSGSTWGTVSTSHFGGSYDSEIIAGTTSVTNSVWANPGATSRQVSSVFKNPVAGLAVCNDGSYTLENCRGSIASTGNTACYSNEGGTCVSGLLNVKSTNGSIIVQSGDSGGPCYQDASGYAAVGLISGLSGTGQTSTSSFVLPVSKVLAPLGANLAVKTS